MNSDDINVTVRRSLHWERGLKLAHKIGFCSGARSLPSLGAWIETLTILLGDGSKSRSLHWERGLKPNVRRSVCMARVAPFIGSVD